MVTHASARGIRNANRYPFGQHDEVDVGMSGQKGSERLFDGLLVGRKGDRFICRIGGTVLATHGEDRQYTPAFCIIVCHCSGNRAILVANHEHPVGVTDWGRFGRSRNPEKSRGGRIFPQRRQHTPVAQPLLTPLGPRCGGLASGPHAEAVAAGGVDVQFGGHACPLQCQVHRHAVLSVDPIIMSLDEKARRGLRRDADFRRQFGGPPFDNAARIDHHGEIRPARRLIRRIDLLIRPLVEIRRCPGGQVPAGRESQHADSLGVDAPIGRLAPYQADRPLGIHEGLDRRRCPSASLPCAGRGTSAPRP